MDGDQINDPTGLADDASDDIVPGAPSIPPDEEEDVANAESSFE